MRLRISAATVSAMRNGWTRGIDRAYPFLSIIRSIEGTTMDYDMGGGVAELRSELRELVHEHIPADYLGAFTPDPADLEIAQQFCRLLAERGLLCMAWPEEWGGRGAT